MDMKLAVMEVGFEKNTLGCQKEISVYNQHYAEYFWSRCFKTGVMGVKK